MGAAALWGYSWRARQALRTFDVALFADADLEMMPLSEGEPHAVSRTWQRAIGRFLASRAVILAEPDTLAPLNTGFMLVKPSDDLYAEGRDVRRATPSHSPAPPRVTPRSPRAARTPPALPPHALPRAARE